MVRVLHRSHFFVPRHPTWLYCTCNLPVIMNFFASDQLLISHDFLISGEKQMTNRLYFETNCHGEISPHLRIEPGTPVNYKSDAFSTGLFRWTITLETNLHDFCCAINWHCNQIYNMSEKVSATYLLFLLSNDMQ